MCLLTTEMVKTANEDIVCYKILRNVNGKYFTPFFNKEVEIDKPLIAEGPEYVMCLITNIEVGSGFIHTYAYLDDASYNSRFLRGDYFGYEIFKCIIPKGTKYYEGGTLNYHKSYASKEIRFIKKVTDGGAFEGKSYPEIRKEP